MSHTPGPWFTTKCSNGGKIVHRGIGHELTTQCVQIIPDADADLIAAAPELLDAIRRGHQKMATYAHVFSGDKELLGLLKLWSDLIEKAKGKS